MTMEVFIGQDLVQVTTIGTSVQLHDIEHFRANNYQHFVGFRCIFWSIFLLSNPLRGVPSMTCGKYFIAIKRGFWGRGGCCCNGEWDAYEELQC